MDGWWTLYHKTYLHNVNVTYSYCGKLWGFLLPSGYFLSPLSNGKDKAKFLTLLTLLPQQNMYL